MPIPFLKKEVEEKKVEELGQIGADLAPQAAPLPV
jgi:hypothetical protein